VASTRLSRRRFLKMAGLSVAGAGVLGAGYARGVEPGWVDVEHVEVSIAGLARVFDGYRVVQIGDVHADGWMTPERLSDAVRIVNAERPDLVAFTGDLVTADDFSDVPAAEVAPRLVGPLRGCGPGTARWRCSGITTTGPTRTSCGGCSETRASERLVTATSPCAAMETRCTSRGWTT
jgi:hypothetical protein